MSVIGYGSLLKKILLKGDVELTTISYGLLGIWGIFTLILLSYITNIFLPHSMFHNSIVHIIGFLLFIYYFLKNKFSLRKNFPVYIITFSILFIGLIIFKNHDDFPYYHFPYINYLINSKLQFGIGYLNHGFATPSSIFYLNSLFYLPFIEFKALNFGYVIILGFTNIFLLEKIFSIKKNKNDIFITIFSLLYFIFINVFFYRISEHGTDRSAQILAGIFFIFLFEIINENKIDTLKLKNFLILTALIISLKSLYILYTIFIIYILVEKNKIIFRTITKIKITILFCIIYGIIYLMINFANTGCLIYPVNFTCFNDFSWAFSSDRVNHMRDWYELWSKSGANPNYRVENPSEYISGLNWFFNWIDKYFFTKVTDFILGLLFLMSIIYFFSKKKKLVKINFNYKFIFILFFILMIEWFYNHPSLRYGGYNLFAITFFLPLCIFLSKRIELKKNYKVFFNLIIITFIIFSVRNFVRINEEIKIYGLNLLKPNYQITQHDFRVEEQMNLIKSKNKCIKNLKQKNCKITKDTKEAIKVSKKYNYIIYSLK